MSWADDLAASSGAATKKKSSWADSLGGAQPAQTGGGFWESAAGAGRTLVDLISRPNYAAAGAAEELFSPKGGGIAAVPGRVASEIFSGVGPVKGQKESFAEVMEQAGVGELGKLSDVMPFVPKWADVTGRGALGLGLDIATDPTTWITAGGSAARKIVTRKGARYLSKEGQVALNAIDKTLEPAFKAARALPDEQIVERVAARKALVDQRNDLLEAAIAKDPKLLDKTGIKFMGEEIIPRAQLDKLTPTIARAVSSVPVVGEFAVRQAGNLSSGLRRMFDPYAEIAGLPEDVREGMKYLIRENASAAAAHKTALYAQWNDIEKQYAAAAKSYGKGDAGKQALGRKFAAWREQTGTPTLTATEQALFKKIGEMYDLGEALALKEGLIDPNQAAKYSGKYLHHEYKNPEVLSETARQSGRPVGAPVASEQFQRVREFDTYAQAEEASRGLNEIGKQYREAGGKWKVYGKLEPEYDATKNLASYIQQLTDSTWRKRTIAEARDKFGLALDDTFDAGKVYDLTAGKALRNPERMLVDATLAAKLKDGKQDWAAVATSARSLSPDGQRQMAKELLAEARNPSDVLKVRAIVGDAHFPTARVLQPGQKLEYFEKYGQPGDLISRSGSLWGDKEVLIPQMVDNLIGDAPRDIVKDAATKAKLQGLVKAYDKYTNAFKAATYPFYPSGAVRDTYNNLMQAYLGIGVGALMRPTQAARVLRGEAGDIIRLGATDYTAAELKNLAKDLGVIDPTARSFVQFTGKEGAEKASALTKARAARGSVDNATRTQLFINSLAAGSTPETAAQVVKDFLFDYSELSSFDRDVMRRIMPFYVFPRKVIGNTAKVLSTTPGRLTNLTKPFRGREDENNSMSQWEGEGFKIRLDRNGKDLTVLNGIDLPVRSIDMLWKGSPRKTIEGALAMSAPALKVPYELASGRDPFRGQEFGRIEAHALGPVIAKLPKAFQATVGFKEERDQLGRPKYTYRQDVVQMAAEALVVSRILSTSDRFFREQTRDPNLAARLLDFTTGIRWKTLNLDEEMAKRAKRRERELQDRAVKQGEAKEFRKVDR